MENCIALIAVTRLVNKEMVPALLPLVSKLMDHKRCMLCYVLSNADKSLGKWGAINHKLSEFRRPFLLQSSTLFGGHNFQYISINRICD